MNVQMSPKHQETLNQPIKRFIVLIKCARLSGGVHQLAALLQ